MAHITTATPQANAGTVIGLLNTKQAAATLGISVRSLQEHAAARDLAFVKIGRSIRFDPADLAVFINKNRRRARGWKEGA